MTETIDKDVYIKKWKNKLKGHGPSCKCPQKTISRLKQSIITCDSLERSERSRLIDLFESKDSENWEVALHIIFEKIPDLFTSVIKTPGL
jgi:hypothetical protein